MNNSSIKQLLEATIIIINNIGYILMPVLITSSLYLSRFVSKDFEYYYIVTIYLILAVIIPSIYGQFIYLIETGQKEKWYFILKKYWWTVFIVSAILKVPIFIATWVLPKIEMIKFSLILLIGIITIYVLPLALFRGKILSSIEMGVKCFLGNFKFSFPFVVVLVLLQIMSVAINTLSNHLNILALSYSASIFLIFISTFVEYGVFVSAALVLKEKLLKIENV